jgi:hypothetical protein
MVQGRVSFWQGADIQQGKYVHSPIGKKSHYIQLPCIESMEHQSSQKLGTENYMFFTACIWKKNEWMRLGITV